MTYASRLSSTGGTSAAAPASVRHGLAPAAAVAISTFACVVSGLSAQHWFESLPVGETAKTRTPVRDQVATVPARAGVMAPNPSVGPGSTPRNVPTVLPGTNVGTAGAFVAFANTVSGETEPKVVPLAGPQDHVVPLY